MGQGTDKQTELYYSVDSPNPGEELRMIGGSRILHLAGLYSELLIEGLYGKVTDFEVRHPGLES